MIETTQTSLSDLKRWALKYIQEQIIRGERPCLSSLDKKFGTFGGIGRSPIFRQWLQNIFTLEFLQALIFEKENFEILILGPRKFFTDRGLGVQSQQLDTNDDEQLNTEELNLALELWAQGTGQGWNFNRPFISFECELFAERFRATLIHQSLSPDKSHRLFLRRLGDTPLKAENIIDANLLPFILSAIRAKKNILITGATASGKTTLMRALVQEIRHEHLVVLEDVAEIDQYPGHTHLLSRENHGLKELLSYALRMRPDRIWLGEIRSQEVVPLFMALNTGHRGMLATLHADSAPEALSRLTMLFLIYSNLREMGPGPVSQLITQNIDYVIHMSERKISHVIRWIGGGHTQRPAFEILFGKIVAGTSVPLIETRM
ncbi:MAG: Flp pilus assembly complex ATPase component TadA [Bdellovibrio sp.]|nr:Flp pilus assembly complex ATPase component TadA [Bdellovibrio sp.]